MKFCNPQFNKWVFLYWVASLVGIVLHPFPELSLLPVFLREALLGRVGQKTSTRRRRNMYIVPGPVGGWFISPVRSHFTFVINLWGVELPHFIDEETETKRSADFAEALGTKQQATVHLPLGRCLVRSATCSAFPLLRVCCSPRFRLRLSPVVRATFCKAEKMQKYRTLGGSGRHAVSCPRSQSLGSGRVGINLHPPLKLL